MEVLQAKIEYDKLIKKKKSVVSIKLISDFALEVFYYYICIFTLILELKLRNRITDNNQVVNPYLKNDKKYFILIINHNCRL